VIFSKWEEIAVVSEIQQRTKVRLICPQLNSHYQTFTTKAFMKIGAITTGVASPVTLDKICLIML